MEIRQAADIYEQLKTLRYQLDQLAEQGRIVMSHDSYNIEHHESAPAIAAALAGLDTAINATCWMETLATTDGEYPLLKN